MVSHIFLRFSLYTLVKMIQFDRRFLQTGVESTIYIDEYLSRIQSDTLLSGDSPCVQPGLVGASGWFDLLEL